MLNWQENKNRIFLRLVSLIMLQVFILMGVAYPETRKKDIYNSYILQGMNEKLRPIMSSKDIGFKDRFDEVVKKSTTHPHFSLISRDNRVTKSGVLTTDQFEVNGKTYDIKEINKIKAEIRVLGTIECQNPNFKFVIRGSDKIDKGKLMEFLDGHRMIFRDAFMQAWYIPEEIDWDVILTKLFPDLKEFSVNHGVSIVFDSGFTINGEPWEGGIKKYEINNENNGRVVKGAEIVINPSLAQPWKQVRILIHEIIELKKIQELADRYPNLTIPGLNELVRIGYIDYLTLKTEIQTYEGKPMLSKEIEQLKGTYNEMQPLYEKNSEFINWVLKGNDPKEFAGNKVAMRERPGDTHKEITIILADRYDYMAGDNKMDNMIIINASNFEKMIKEKKEDVFIAELITSCMAEELAHERGAEVDDETERMLAKGCAFNTAQSIKEQGLEYINFLKRYGVDIDEQGYMGYLVQGAFRGKELNENMVSWLRAIAMPANEQRKLEKNEALARLYTTKQRIKLNLPRNYGDVGKPVLMVGEIYREDGRIEPVEKFGLRLEKDNEALTVIVSRSGAIMDIGSSGGRVWGIDYETTLIVDENGNSKAYFGKLTRSELISRGILIKGDIEEGKCSILYGSAIEFKGIGTWSCDGTEVIIATLDKNTAKEGFKRILQEAQLDERIIDSAIEGFFGDIDKITSALREIAVPYAMIKEMDFLDKDNVESVLESLNISADEQLQIFSLLGNLSKKQTGTWPFGPTEEAKFKIVKEANGKYIIFKFERIPENLKDKPGIFIDYRYQTIIPDPPGGTIYEVEKGGVIKQAQALQLKAPLNTVIVDVTPSLAYKIGNDDIMLGMSTRVRIGDKGRLFKADLARMEKGDKQIQLRLELRGQIKGKEQGIFYNIGLATKVFFSKGLSFSCEEIFEGKDVDIRGRIADIGDFESWHSEEKQRLLLYKWLRLLIELNVSINCADDLKGLFDEQIISPTPYLNVFSSLFLDTKGESLLKEYLNSIFEKNEEYVEKIIQDIRTVLTGYKYKGKINNGGEKLILSKWGNRDRELSKLSMVIAEVAGEVIYNEWRNLEFKKIDERRINKIQHVYSGRVCQDQI